MPKDQFGTKIYKGNRVVLNPPNGMLSGIVAQIDEGKVSMVMGDGREKARPGHMVVMVDIHIMWDPNSDGTIGSVVVAMAQPLESDAAFQIPSNEPKRITN